jgi:hypothetical protein
MAQPSHAFLTGYRFVDSPKGETPGHVRLMAKLRGTRSAAAAAAAFSPWGPVLTVIQHFMHVEWKLRFGKHIEGIQPSLPEDGVEDEVVVKSMVMLSTSPT